MKDLMDFRGYVVKICNLQNSIYLLYFITLERVSEENDFLVTPGTCLLHFVSPKRSCGFQNLSLFSPLNLRTISSKIVTKERNALLGWKTNSVVKGACL